MGSFGPSRSRQRQKVNEEDILQIENLFLSSSTRVLRPHHPSYDEAITVWSAAVKKPAGVVLQPTTAEDVSAILRYAVYRSLDFSVKGGGHSTAGASTSDGGILIDLYANMRQVEVDVDNQVVRVQGGAIWRDVDTVCWKHGLAVVGGTVAHTGVGGLVLDGGHGWLSGLKGMAIDNLVECTLVLPCGEILKVSDDLHPELFWALKGAGQNFGVVTEFVLKAHKVDNVWAGQLFFQPEPEIISKVVSITNSIFAVDANGKTRHGPRVAGGLGIGQPKETGHKTTLLVPIVFFGDEEEGMAIFKDLLAINHLASTVATVPYPNINNFYDTPYGLLRASMKGMGFLLPMRPQFILNVLDAFKAFVDDSGDCRNESLVLWEIYDPHEIATRQDAGCFANRGCHFNGMIAGSWLKAENDEGGRQWVRDIVDIFKQELRSVALQKAAAKPSLELITPQKPAPPMFYGNYDQYADGRVVFAGNYSRLQAVKARYDPLNTFDKLFSIEPRLEHIRTS